MTPREERLLALEVRADKRRRRRKAAFAIAAAFDRGERAAMWLNLTRQADRLQTLLWQARVAAGVRRWQADDAAQVLRAVEP